jgi:hypothetical protein
MVGIRKPLLVGGQTAHVVHLEEELTETNGVAGTVLGQLEQEEGLTNPMVFPHDIEGELGADLRVVEVVSPIVYWAKYFCRCRERT